MNFQHFSASPFGPSPSPQAVYSYLKSVGYNPDKYGIFKSGSLGYWSNLSKQENNLFMSLLDKETPEHAVNKFIPQFYEMIFSEKREGALELLDHREPGLCIDFGCMWGVMSFAMSKRGHTVLAVDQTYESLRFVAARTQSLKLDSVYPVQCDIRTVNFKNIADFAIVNGVLEWIPTTHEVIVSDYYKPAAKIKLNFDLDLPREMQVDFLKRVHSSLKQGGNLLLAIENANNFEYFLGKSDPHVNLLFTPFLPRFISNIISLIFKGRPYKNYIYSFKSLERLVLSAGFKKCELYSAFPDYHFPELIVPFSHHSSRLFCRYDSTRRTTFKQRIVSFIEYVLMRKFKAFYLSPAIILVAEK